MAPTVGMIARVTLPPHHSVPCGCGCRRFLLGFFSGQNIGVGLNDVDRARTAVADDLQVVESVVAAPLDEVLFDGVPHFYTLGVRFPNRFATEAIAALVAGGNLVQIAQRVGLHLGLAIILKFFFGLVAKLTKQGGGASLGEAHAHPLLCRFEEILAGDSYAFCQEDGFLLAFCVLGPCLEESVAFRLQTGQQPLVVGRLTAAALALPLHVGLAAVLHLLEKGPAYLVRKAHATAC
mmetsp:Transcript_98181/g.204791  ORF Transcript_98181/g.204791 Transcript_98181/m.204791 type:complete len:236 (+) Transcript_98181:601-1308(+)